MKRKLLILLLALASVFALGFGLAACGDSDNGQDKIKDSEGLEYELKNNEYTVTGMGTCKDTAIYIPKTHEGLPVTSIGEGAFAGCESLESITLPTSVTNIGESTFERCLSLESIIIPDSVKSIGSSAFKNCSALTSITIGNGVKSIGSYAFSNCKSLTSISLPDGVTRIEDSVFRYCSALTKISLPDGVTSIGEEAFHYCSSLTSITIPDGATSIGWAAFGNCSSLTSITIPDSVTNIKRDVFASCNSLTIYCQVVSKPSGWNSQWNYSNYPVVWDCNNNDKDENGYAYSVVDGVRYSLKAGVATVVEQPTNITSVNIPTYVTYKNKVYSVTNICEKAFYGCHSLENIYITDIAAWCNISGLSYLMECGKSSKNLYLNNTLITDLVIPNSMTIIKDGTFQGCSSLESVTIPNSVTSIEDHAFYGCTSLASINFAGTKAQWNAIEKSIFWNSYIGNYTVHCSDGDITE